jgi:hypothetical protein
MAEHHDLPGWPKKALVKRVRSHLWHYGIRPKGQAWRAAWSWASEIANSYYRTHWPLASEIASQYVLLLLAHMKENRSLHLPYRAGKVIPEDVQRLLPSSPLLMLTDERNVNSKLTSPNRDDI